MVNIQHIREARGLINMSFPREAGSENNTKSIPSFVGDDFNGYSKIVSAFDAEVQKGDNCSADKLAEFIDLMLDKHEKAVKDLKSAKKFVKSK
jgi:hypothetical protein